MKEEDFVQELKVLKRRYTSESYHLFKNNCNHFSDECTRLLKCTRIPKDIVDLPDSFLSTPMGKQLEPMLIGMQEKFRLGSNKVFDGQGN